LHKRENGLVRWMLQFRLTDPDPLNFHNEPIFRDGVILGCITSGHYCHSLGGAMGLGYVPRRHAGKTVKEMSTSTYQIDIAGRMVGA
tara:strand:- start:5802 stop:6062 length:261 start_codon:yes stop_codon:yes gene_type:complete